MKINISLSQAQTNSLNLPIHYTPLGIANFYKWFGKSKAVDSKHRPLVLFHGTAASYDHFDGFVNWFSADAKFASDYADLRDLAKGHGANVIPVYLRMSNPFNADHLSRGANTVASFVMEMSKQSLINYDIIKAKTLLTALREAALQKKSGPSYRPYDFWFNVESAFGKNGKEAIKDLLALFGFDSIIFTEEGQLTYGVLHPNQAKSAVGNSGTFDINKNSIIAAAKNTILIDGRKRSTVNSLGNPIAKTEQGIINFWKWFGDSKIVDKQKRPLVVYHGTAKKFSVINMRKGAQNLFWFASSKAEIESGDSGAAAVNVIMELYVKIINPADWKQYDQFGIGEFTGRGLDGAILKSGNHFDGFVLNANQVKSVYNKDNFDAVKGSIYANTNYQSNLDALMVEFEQYGIECRLFKNHGIIILSKIIVPKKQRNKHIGSTIMNRVCDYADANGLTVALSPSSDFGGSKTRLLNWYKSFGFVSNSGRNKDYSIGETMLRRPK